MVVTVAFFAKGSRCIGRRRRIAQYPFRRYRTAAAAMAACTAQLGQGMELYCRVYFHIASSSSR